MSTAQEQQGSFECVRQLDSRRLELLGGLQYRLQVQANDDVYETTRQRVADAEQASKKNCTRVLKQSDHLVGRRVKSRPMLTARRRSAPTAKPAPAPAPSKPTPPAAPSRPPVPAVLARPAAGSRPTPPAAAAAAAARRTVTASSGSSSSGGGGARNGSSASSAASDLMKRPLRERIAHMLATRPYKRVEVVQKLYKDGIRETDKKNVPALLANVATLRDNVYHLKRHMWSELTVHWPFYSDTERQQFLSRQPPSSPPAAAAAPAAAVSPSQSAAAGEGAGGDPAVPVRHSHQQQQQARLLDTGGRPGDGTSLPGHRRKRAAVALAGSNGSAGGGDYDTAAAPVSAKRRPPSAAPSSSPHPPAAADWIKWSSDDRMAAGERDGGVANGIVGVASGGGVVSGRGRVVGGAKANETAGQSPSSAGVSDRTPTPDSSPETSVHETTVTTAAGAGTTAAAGGGGGSADYLARYPPIQCAPQMLSYRAAFERGYREYQQLWQLMDAVRRKFDCLERRLRSCTPGSDQWQDIERRIRAEYAACNTAEYRSRRERWLYLQNKLVHIKTLVRQWQRTDAH